MQLKRLEAYGFKSFADKINIDFDKGITAIVGPNGSGKSNITDAIRWVLGEQNIRNLRGTKAEDIIFTGSAARKALGVAEVSLVFENNGELPVDFKEVVVTRRIFRSGESEFYINRSRCRLKDIYNLFADTGIGHDGMSIIGQNRIDDILNSKPEDRRAFFEETAGITKYRNRKRETLRKLEDMEGNLVRVNDIIHEIEVQLEPLAEQAEKKRKHNALAGELEKYRLTGIHQK
ncbi:MAG: AAA family ATPase, partial [Selenomonadaceae bacterium]|nr:AAA family ATPase [Selenomonadaceae bacterium]